MKNELFFLSLALLISGTAFSQDNLLEKGNLYLNRGDFDQAEKVFREGMKSDTTDLIFQCQLGLTLIQKRRI
jgi:Flp pilus assembly protein TadD